MAEDERLKSILGCKTVAVVGLSRDPAKDSHKVAAYLKNHGCHIVPINPFADEILGEKCYKSLLDALEELQRTIEVVDIFRPCSKIIIGDYWFIKRKRESDCYRFTPADIRNLLVRASFRYLGAD